MTEFQFDRDAAGVTAKADWVDSQTFSNIAAGVDGMYSYSYTSIVKLPEDTVGGTGKTDNAGREELRDESTYSIELLNLILLELSDACGILGSGTATASNNFDATETNTTESFNFLTGEVEA